MPYNSFGEATGIRDDNWMFEVVGHGGSVETSTYSNDPVSVEPSRNGSSLSRDKSE